MDRIKTIMRAHNLSSKAFGNLLNISPSKISKVINGNQSLPAEAVGTLIKEFHIHPNWIFGYEGNPNEVMYMGDLIHKSELDKKEQEKIELERENLRLYKRLAEHLEQKAAEGEVKYQTAKKENEDNSQSLENLKNS